MTWGILGPLDQGEYQQKGGGDGHRDLVVTMPGSKAWVCRFESPLDTQAGWPGRYIDARRCGGLSMVFLPLKDPLELFVKTERNFFPVPGFLLVVIMTFAIESDVKPHSLPLLQRGQRVYGFKYIIYYQLTWKNIRMGQLLLLSEVWGCLL